MVATAGAGIGSQGRNMRPVAIWLLFCTALVFLMVVVGGLTRLTHSGLSIVDWRPITGWLPPLDAAAWQSVFENYQRFPEYQKLNQGMTLGEFQSIFWFEYLHRLLGRSIGVAFLLPFLWFMISRRIGGRLAWRLGIIFGLGAAQGGVGWWMVRSGLVDQPDVSHYRLATHLGLAVVIYGLLLWTALSLLRDGGRVGISERRMHRGALGCLAAVFITIVSGALVAGLDAGFAYNTFPTMNGMWIPDGVMALTPWYANLLENTITVQFDHRWLAIATSAGIFALWWRERSRSHSRYAQLALHAVAVAVLFQVALGIATVVLVVPLAVAAAHQGNAMILLSAAVTGLHALQGPVNRESGNRVME
jgi:cytochrome c oxidase assembly protein subunit 15